MLDTVPKPHRLQKLRGVSLYHEAEEVGEVGEDLVLVGLEELSTGDFSPGRVVAQELQVAVLALLSFILVLELVLACLIDLVHDIALREGSISELDIKIYGKQHFICRKSILMLFEVGEEMVFNEVPPQVEVQGLGVQAVYGRVHGLQQLAWVALQVHVVS